MKTLDKLYSDKPLGCNVENGSFIFRVFAPRATEVILAIFDSSYDFRKPSREYEMEEDENGVWEFSINENMHGRYYGYKVDGPQSYGEMFDADVIIADPYSPAVATGNTYHHEARTLILDSSYDWEGDTFLNIPHEDLIIYEMHVRDMTADETSHVKNKGTYKGLIEKNKRGGLSYLKDLGVNAVELLPCQDFANVEIPYHEETPDHGFNQWEVNTWNPYERNHWGYMTSYFFAPANYYASNETLDPEKYNGVDGRQVTEFKDMVKEFHKQGISVIMDVVYNHVAHYDYNPFKYIDKKYYFRLNPDMSFIKKSGCGNDFKTERKMARKMIVDSIKHWMTEYHVDGFRFDLAIMIDIGTLELITQEARKINPNVILIAEPWGGGDYNLGVFSDLGWAAWNDLIRNGVKGSNPYDGKGFIFGNAHDSSSLNNLKIYTIGSLREYGLPFIKTSHSVNYLESHDDHTMGDFIRLATGDAYENSVITDINHHAMIRPLQMRMHKLAALFLLTSQGMIMIHEGQEFARSKVIAPTDCHEPGVGMIDKNSYAKDNETNWINYDHKDMNIELVDYYKGLIEIRKKHKAFRHSSVEALEFIDSLNNKCAFGYLLEGEETGDNDFIVLLNGSHSESAAFEIHKGNWHLIADHQSAGTEHLKDIKKSVIIVPPISGILLINEG